VTATDAIDRLRRFLAQDLWRVDLRSSRLVTWCVRALQLVVVVGEGFVRDRVLVRATALAYVTSLALIPVLAIAFSIIGAFGIREDVARFLVEQIAAGSPAAVEWILRFVADVKLGSLGTLGAVVLFATTILTVGNVERAFNDIFGVRLQRTWTRRLPDYLAVLVVAPLLVGVALSLGTVVRSQWVVQRLLEVENLQAMTQVARQAPILLLYAGGFAFLYWFLPNTTVRPLSAVLGGAVAALLFNGAQAAYVGFNVGAARYDAWIYVSWAIVLLGAEIAYAHQHLGRYSREVRTGEARAAQLETLGLAVALEVARAFRDGGRPLTADALATELDVAIRVVRDVLSDLELAGIVAPRGGDPREGSMQLGRPAEHITVSDVRTALRGPAGELPAQPGLPQLAARISREIDAEAQRGPGAHTLADLLSETAGG
jgi:membrane protein